MSQSRSESGGYDYSFVGTPDDDLVCSICLLVQREPALTSCCGNHFCHSCIDSVRAQLQPCPLCNAHKFSTMIDKYFERKVKELVVRCPQKGCDWEGSLSVLDTHRDIDRGSCRFLFIGCPNLCGEKVPTAGLEEHNKVCPRRQHTCKFCGYRGVYEEMSTKHWTVCDNYPLPCPNKCGELDIKRRDLPAHKERDCPLQLVKCEYVYCGCEVHLTRSNLPRHLSENTQHHLSLVSRQCAQLVRQFPPDYAQRVGQELAARDAEIQQLRGQLKQREQDLSKMRTHLHTLEEELEDVKSDCVSLKSTVFLPPVEFIMTDFLPHKTREDQWLSPPFYSHLGGYCFCLSVDANGSEDGGGSHTSIYVNLMKGEYDQHLRWPFHGSINVSLCNQRGSKGSIEESILFGYDAPPEVAGRVQGDNKVAESGLGIPRFVEHAQLGFNLKKNTEYLKNNCLRLKVVGVVVNG